MYLTMPMHMFDSIMLSPVIGSGYYVMYAFRK